MKTFTWILGGAGIVYLIYTINKKRMNLTPNFTIWEFQSKDGAPFPLEVLRNLKKLAENLEIIRAEINKPIKINSGYRSPAHNAAVGGVHDSMHLTGKAADIVVSGISPLELSKVIERLISENKIKQGGLGIYPGFIHYDIRGNKARW